MQEVFQRLPRVQILLDRIVVHDRRALITDDLSHCAFVKCLQHALPVDLTTLIESLLGHFHGCIEYLVVILRVDVYRQIHPFLQIKIAVLPRWFLLALSLFLALRFLPYVGYFPLRTTVTAASPDRLPDPNLTQTLGQTSPPESLFLDRIINPPLLAYFPQRARQIDPLLVDYVARWVRHQLGL